MEQTKPDLTICQDCHNEPAIYGDGLTWARGSACEQKRRSAAGQTPLASQPPVETGELHKIEKDLVSIIIPVYMNNYTLFHYTGNCIGSVREHTKPGTYQLVIVDNGSPLKPPSPRSYYAHKVIVNEENRGVTKAWNQGIRMSNGEYIVLLNNDVQVFNGWLEDMKMYLDSGDADLVMAHPMYSLTEPFARAVEAFEVKEGIRKLDPLDKDFSCVMFKRSLLDEVGGFDERFFNYCSDVDFFKRMEIKGKTWKMLNHVATSHISDATGYSIAETPDIMNKDKERFAEKWAPGGSHADMLQLAQLEKEKLNTKGKVKLHDLIRVEGGGDPLYLLVTNSEKQVGTLHHIKDPDTLHALGFEFGEERMISATEFGEQESGEEINMENVKKYV